MDIHHLTESVIGSAFQVGNTLGPGFVESVYERALVLEIQKLNLKVERQKPVNVFYDGECVGEFVADLLIEDALIIELKATAALATAHEVQLVNYLKATGINHGLLINFGTPKVQIRHKYRTPPPSKPTIHA